MESSQFDRLTVALGTKLTRRRTLAVSAAGIAAAGWVNTIPALAQDAATPVGQVTEHPVFLFVQLADGGTWTPSSETDGTYFLTLYGTGDQTLYFSDRPDRISGAMPTDQFLGALGFTPVNPPNAAVVVTTPAGDRDVLVVELFDPVYSGDSEGNGEETLQYTAIVLNAYKGTGLEEWVPQADDDRLPADFSNVSLFIDDCADASGCYLKSGVSWQYQGEIPGGPYGRCFDWTDYRCYPCSVDGESLDQMCNDAFPSCNGNCTTDTCGNYGIC